MRYSSTIFFALTLALLLAAVPAAAHELSMPAEVQADGVGHFAFEVTIVISDPIEFGYAYTNGTDNTDIGEWYGDGFCLEVIEPGTYVWPIEGNLVDPAQNGSVYYEHVMCDDWIGSGTTIVLAPPVSAEAVSWTSVKGLYR